LVYDLTYQTKPVVATNTRQCNIAKGIQISAPKFKRQSGKLSSSMSKKYTKMTLTTTTTEKEKRNKKKNKKKKSRTFVRNARQGQKSMNEHE
jgi:hypothetical protein